MSEDEVDAIPVVGGLSVAPKDGQAAQDLLILREEEMELENERPCIFKSLSPVRPVTRDCRLSTVYLSVWI